MIFKRFIKVLGILAVISFVFLAGAALYIKNYLPRIPLKPLTVELTKERIARGAYLANQLLSCIDCHSIRDYTKYAGPVVPGTEGMGGTVFDRSMGLPGKYISTNITPYELGSWSDAEIYRAITAGVGKENNALFQIMPYQIFGTLPDEEIYCVIAYLRTLKPLKSYVPPSVTDFPVNLFLNTMPAEGQPGEMPSEQDRIKYGEYLARIACKDCHTPQLKGKLIEEQAYRGDREFIMPGGKRVKSVDITFSSKGIGSWSADRFITTFKNYDPGTYVLVDVSGEGKNTIMPWTLYGGLKESDLTAIYSYLKSLPTE
ncbi:MAG: cytochrome c [FCB group bacterium]|nr:cytochrome c [FCB group bacterium]